MISSYATGSRIGRTSLAGQASRGYNWCRFHSAISSPPWYKVLDLEDAINYNEKAEEWRSTLVAFRRDGPTASSRQSSPAVPLDWGLA